MPTVIDKHCHSMLLSQTCTSQVASHFFQVKWPTTSYAIFHQVKSQVKEKCDSSQTRVQISDLRQQPWRSVHHSRKWITQNCSLVILETFTLFKEVLVVQLQYCRQLKCHARCVDNIICSSICPVISLSTVVMQGTVHCTVQPIKFRCMGTWGKF